MTTSVFVTITSPSQIYEDLNIPTQFIVSDGKFIERLRERLIDALEPYSVSSVTVGIKRPSLSDDLYNLNIVNVKNVWQEENIRETCDEVCLNFTKKHTLIQLKDS
jgi:hypothetical protein